MDCNAIVSVILAKKSSKNNMYNLPSDIFDDNIRAKENSEERKEKNKLRARQTRKRKKDYIETLEEQIGILEAENHRLRQIIEESKNKEAKQHLSEEAVSLEKVQEIDKKMLEMWVNGKSWWVSSSSDNAMTDKSDNKSVDRHSVNKVSHNYTRIQFL